MKKQPTSRSAFFNPRPLIGLVLCSIGLFLAAAGWSKSLPGMTTTATSSQSPGMWMLTGRLNTARALFTATLLPSGQVLVAGGCTDLAGNCHNGIAGAELYDPSTGRWTPTGSMAIRRVSHTATLLPSGKVLVAGGETDAVALSSAELYDPSNGTWTPTGSTNTPRAGHSATLITTGQLSGMVLAAGGSNVCRGCDPVLASAELYDESTGTWSSTGSMALARSWNWEATTALPVVFVGAIQVRGLSSTKRVVSDSPLAARRSQNYPFRDLDTAKPLFYFGTYI